MDAPKCKICGEKHYGLCPEFRTVGNPPAKPKAPTQQVPDIGQASVPRKGRSRPNAPRSDPIPPNSPNKMDADHSRQSNGFDKVAYQRDYMRKRRAKQKEEGK